MNSVRIINFSGPYFPALGLNTDEKNFEYGHFLHSVELIIIKVDLGRWLELTYIASYLNRIIIEINQRYESYFHNTKRFQQLKPSHFPAGIYCSKSTIETPEQCVKAVQNC